MLLAKMRGGENMEYKEKWLHKDLHTLIPRGCEYVTISGKGYFLDMIKNPKVGKVFWLSGRAHCNHKGSQKWKMEVKESQREV